MLIENKLNLLGNFNLQKKIHFFNLKIITTVFKKKELTKTNFD